MSAARRRLIAIALLTAVTGLACSLPHDNQPRALATDDVPFSLLASSTTAPPPEPQGAVDRTLFFVKEGRLTRVTEALSSGTANDVIGALLLGPASDSPEGVSTAIPLETRLITTAPTTDNVLIIDLSRDILAVEATEQKIAFAQLVYTAYALREIAGVRFRVEGEDLQVTTDSGSSNGPVVPSDFESLRPIDG
jgi:hypothetical protein